MKKQQRLNWTILDWDSQFFGFIVAQIRPRRLDLKRLRTILLNLKERNVSLVYWAADSKDKNSHQAANSLNGFLADRKMTYAINLKKISKWPVPFKVEEYQRSLPSQELLSLAIQSGLYSRYKLDPNFSQRQFKALYKKWISNSTNKTIADAVLVVRKNRKIIGMVTLSAKHKQGKIGLIAVDSQIRCKGIGTSLIRAAQAWFVQRNCQIAEVVTQQANINSRNLFERNGYRFKKIENFYHFWL